MFFTGKKRNFIAVVDADDDRIAGDFFDVNELPGFDFRAAARAGDFFDAFFADAAGDLPDLTGVDRHDDLRRTTDQILFRDRTRSLLAIQKSAEVENQRAERDAAENAEQRARRGGETQTDADRAETAERGQKNRDHAAVEHAEIVARVQIGREIEPDRVEKVADNQGGQQKQKTQSADRQKNRHQAEIGHARFSPSVFYNDFLFLPVLKSN